MKSGTKLWLALILGVVVLLTFATAPAVQAKEYDNWFKIVRAPIGVIMLPGDLFPYVVMGGGDHDPVPPPPPPTSKGGGDGDHDPVPPPPPPGG